MTLGVVPVVSVGQGDHGASHHGASQWQATRDHPPRRRTGSIGGCHETAEDRDGASEVTLVVWRELEEEQWKFGAEMTIGRAGVVGCTDNWPK